MGVREATREVRLEHWRGIIQGQKSSNQSIRAYCRARGVNEKSYYYWQRQLREGAYAALIARRETALAFAEITPEPEPEPALDYPCESGLGRIIIRPGKGEIEIIGEVTQETMERALRALSSVC